MFPQVYVCSEFLEEVSTAILSVTYRISSELRSQATAGLVSTTVGDHVGIRGAVGSLFFPSLIFSMAMRYTYMYAVVPRCKCLRPYSV